MYISLQDEDDPALCVDLKYNCNTQSLDVTIMECRDLPVVDGKKQHLNP
jgi:membrane-bound inhibitor of C-type lysozyme